MGLFSIIFLAINPLEPPLSTKYVILEYDYLSRLALYNQWLDKIEFSILLWDSMLVLVANIIKECSLWVSARKTFLININYKIKETLKDIKEHK